MTPKELAIIAVKALDDKKGQEISAIEITDLTALADYFVIATGTSNTQINALCGAVEKAGGRGPPAPGGLPGRHLGAAGLRLSGRACVLPGGKRVLRPGAAVEGRQAPGPGRSADKRINLLTKAETPRKIGAVKDFDGKRRGNARLQRAGGRCKPVGALRRTGPGVFRLNRGAVGRSGLAPLPALKGRLRRLKQGGTA